MVDYSFSLIKNVSGHQFGLEGEKTLNGDLIMHKFPLTGGHGGEGTGEGTGGGTGGGTGVLPPSGVDFSYDFIMHKYGFHVADLGYHREVYPDHFYVNESEIIGIPLGSQTGYDTPHFYYPFSGNTKYKYTIRVTAEGYYDIMIENLIAYLVAWTEEIWASFSGPIWLSTSWGFIPKPTE